ncbi:expressed unknown protein [Seminavis robusta]|uniref:Uncharacterized protein n=1 Tax=Seminavis robusta TaxID=568900 RepID=A0A9N8HX83_9STRA|nr:expressed unknown protein [Seminavis robusta]|eukprot:Sro2975_g341320.1 n/a (191) ;mRNA; r:2131-2703
MRCTYNKGENEAQFCVRPSVNCFFTEQLVNMHLHPLDFSSSSVDHHPMSALHHHCEHSERSSSSSQVKHVSFREKIDMIAADGTIDHIALPKQQSPLDDFVEFDGEDCRIVVTECASNDDMMIASYKKFAPRPNRFAAAQAASLNFDGVGFELCYMSGTGNYDHHEMDLEASYKKLAPRAALPYIQRAGT